MIATDKKNFKGKKETFVFPLLFLYAGVILLFISKNSPIYRFNDWVDLNAFETMGNAWAHGIIPYRDLFEQKGPVLYLIFALASFTKSFVGTYFAEVIFMSITLSIFYVIGRIKLKVKSSVLFTLISGTLITMSPFFKTGGSAEEFMFPGIVFSLYVIIKVAVGGTYLPRWVFFISGVIIALMFWTKYTLIGGFIGLFIVLGILYFFCHQFKTLLLAIFNGVLGFTIVTAPIILYFKGQNALESLFHDYFYANIALYPSNSRGIIGKVISALTGLFHTMYAQPVMFIVLVGGICYVAINKKLFADDFGRMLFLGSYFCMIITTLMGGKVSPYYFLPILPYMTIPLFNLIIANERKIETGNIVVLLLLIFVSTIGLNSNIVFSKFFPFNSNMDIQGVKQEPFQISFAKKINQRSNPTLLNYNSLDLGVYRAAEVLPKTKFFEKQNIPSDKLPEMMKSQNEIVEKQKVDFIVTRINYGLPLSKLPSILIDNYRVVDKRDANVSGANFTVVLMERKSNNF